MMDLQVITTGGFLIEIEVTEEVLGIRKVLKPHGVGQGAETLMMSLVIHMGEGVEVSNLATTGLEWGKPVGMTGWSEVEDQAGNHHQTIYISYSNCYFFRDNFLPVQFIVRFICVISSLCITDDIWMWLAEAPAMEAPVSIVENLVIGHRIVPKSETSFSLQHLWFWRHLVQDLSCCHWWWPNGFKQLKDACPKGLQNQCRFASLLLGNLHRGLRFGS